MLHCKLAVVLEALCSMLMVVLQMVVVVYMIRNLFLGFVPMDIRNRTDILVRLKHHSGGPVTSGFVFVAVGFVSKSPKKETENQSKQQPVAAATQVKVEDENMKKSKKIKLSPIKGQARQIKVESPGSKSDSESKDQPKEMTTVTQNQQETNIGTA
jgi:hypothetical protein